MVYSDYGVHSQQYKDRKKMISMILIERSRTIEVVVIMYTTHVTCTNSLSDASIWDFYHRTSQIHVHVHICIILKSMLYVLLMHVIY